MWGSYGGEDIDVGLLGDGRRLLAAEARIRDRVSPRGICSGRSRTKTGFSPSPSGFNRQYQFTDAPYSLM